MAGYHVRLKILFEHARQDNGVQKDGGLGNVGLFQVVVGAVKHQIGDAKAKNFVGFLKKFFGRGMVIVKIFSHSYKLGALTRENVCFHSC